MSKIKVKQIEDLYIGDIVIRDGVQGIQVVIGNGEVIIPHAIQGYQGIQGIQGIQGTQGLQGYQGLQGRGIAEVYVHYGQESNYIPPIEAGEYTLAEFEELWNNTSFANQQDFNNLMWSIDISSNYTNAFIGPDLVMSHPEFRPNNNFEGSYVCFYGRGQNGLQGLQGIKGDNSNIRAREVNEITNYDRKYINISTVGAQSVLEHALASPTSSISVVDISLNSTSPAQISIPSYEFDNAGHNTKQNITNVNIELGFRLADKNTNPTAGLLTKEVPEDASELKGWVYSGNIVSLSDLENLKVGDIVTFHSWVPTLESNGQVYIDKKQTGDKFEPQCKFSLTRYTKQIVGYTSDHETNDSKYLNDYAYMHHLPEHYNLTVLTTEEELKDYKNTLTDYYNSYGKFHYATSLYYTNPNGGELVEGVCYWRIQTVDDILDFGDEVPVSTTIANQIASSTESLTKKIGVMSDSTFISAWISPDYDERYDNIEKDYVWKISYLKLIQNKISPETAAVITLRQLQEDGVWKQLIPDVVFNDNESNLEIHFNEQPENNMKLLVTGKRI